MQKKEQQKKNKGIKGFYRLEIPALIQEPMDESGKFPFMDESGKFPFMDESGKFPLMVGCCLAPTLVDPILNFVKKVLKSVSTHKRGISSL